MRIQVNITKEIFAAIKKREVALGKSRSSTAAELIEAGLGLPASPVVGAPTAEPVFGEGPPPASRLTPEIVRFLVETVAANYALQKKFSRLHSPDNFKEHQERVRVAEGEALEDIKSLGLDHILNPVKAEAVAKAEAILKDLGLDTSHEGGK